MHRILWLCGFLMTASPSARAWDFEGRFRVQLGQEFDSNALRVYGERDSDLVRPDFLTRLVVKAQLAAAHDRNRFSLDYLGGARLFYTEHDEHLLATRLLGRYSHLLPHRRKVGLRLGLMDTSQVVHSRDYLLVDGEVFAGLPIHASTRLEAFAGGRHFNFKPDRDREVLKFSHLGPSMGLRLQSRLSPSWTARLSYRFELRFFDSPIIEDNLDTTLSRQDHRHVLGLKGTFQRSWTPGKRLILQGSYFLSANASNSQGSSALWHRLQAVVSMQLPADLALHLMGTLQFTQYPDGIFLDKSAYEPDADENENAVVLRLSWRMWDELQLVLQTGIYRNDFKTSDVELPSFTRETVMLGLSWGAEL